MAAKVWAKMKKRIVQIIYGLVFFIGFGTGVVYKDYFGYYRGVFDVRMSLHQDTTYFEQIDAVPDKKTALNIAKALWLPVYGRRNLIGYSYKIVLFNEKVWVVSGFIRIYMAQGRYHGGPFIVIDKKSGTILNMGHTGAAPLGWRRTIID